MIRLKLTFVVKTDETVATAVDKKAKGKQFSPLYPAELLSVNDIRDYKHNYANILLICSIMALNVRCGTVLITY